MSIELVVTLKDEERTLKKEFLIYEPVTLVEDDPIIMQCIEEVLDEFKGEPDDIKVRALMVFR